METKKETKITTKEIKMAYNLERLAAWQVANELILLAQADPDEVIRRFNQHDMCIQRGFSLDRIVLHRDMIGFYSNNVLCIVVDCHAKTFLWSNKWAYSGRSFIRNIRWSTFDVSQVGKDVWTCVFQHLSHDTLMHLRLVCKLFERTASQNRFWAQKARKMEQRCLDIVVRKPHLSLFRQAMYYGFRGSCLTMIDYTDLFTRFVMNPAHAEMLTYFLQHDYPAPRRNRKIRYWFDTAQIKRRKLNKPFEVYRQTNNGCVKLKTPAVCFYYLQNKKNHALMWVSKKMKFSMQTDHTREALYRYAPSAFRFKEILQKRHD